MTASEERKYVDRKGTRCLKCGSNQIQGRGTPSVEEGYVFWSVACLECGAEWVDVYKLVGVQVDSETEEEDSVAVAIPLEMSELAGAAIAFISREDPAAYQRIIAGTDYSTEAMLDGNDIVFRFVAGGPSTGRPRK